MISAMGTSASAILAAQDRHAATAVNVANVSADAAPRARVDLATAAVSAGVTATHRVMDPPSSGLVDGMADMSLTGVLYSANLAVLRAQDETVGAVLDIFA
jgi:flagellar basal body rod protein FlgC